AAQFLGGMPLGELQAIALLVATLLTFTLLFFTLGIALGGYVTFGRNVAAAGRKVGIAFDRRRSDWEPATEEAKEAKEPLLKRLFGEFSLPSIGALFRRGDADGVARREPQFEHDAPEIDLPEPGII